MNQEKIGRFLSELRKEQGMTQQQLADAIGVSNKTISKWECGKGMPEISIITPLCEMLKINVNELLSGERLPEDGYSKKAEENMMSLIQETEISKKKNRNSMSIIFVTLITVLLVGGLTILSSGGISMSLMLLDWPTLLPMLLVAIFFLLGTRLGGSFVQAFLIVTGKKKAVSQEEQVQAKAALRLASNALLGMGVFETCVGFIAMLHAGMSNPTLIAVETLPISISIALLGILYGLFGFLLLLPIRMKLEAMCIKEYYLEGK